MNAEKTIALARKHLGGEMESSAALCLADAYFQFGAGNYEEAHARALRSLSYSVGVLHPAYVEAR